MPVYIHFLVISVVVVLLVVLYLGEHTLVRMEKSAADGGVDLEYPGALKIPRPQIPDPGRVVLTARVHPMSVRVKAHGSDVFRDAIVIDYAVGIVGGEVEHPNVLIAGRRDHMPIRR